MSRRRLLPWLVPLLVGAVVQAMVLGRIAGEPMRSYGGAGAQFHPHSHRVFAWMAVQDGFAGRRNLLALPLELDGEFPPLLHLVTGLLIAPFGHSLWAAMASGMLWVALLAWATGVLAARLSRRVPGTDHVAGAAAATGVLLLGSLQGFSFRYYYDVPFTALLYAGLAVLVLGWDEGRARTWVLGGLLLAGAALTKWTALPYGGLMGLGLLAVAWRGEPSRRRGRLRTLVSGGVLCAVVSVGYALASQALTGASSFGAMFDTFNAEAMRQPTWTSIRLQFYLTWAVRSVLSPALAMALLPLLLAWAVKGRDGAWFVGATVLGQLAFVWGTVPVLDERFILSAIPAGMVAAGLGLARLGRLGVAWGAVVVAVGLGVSWDFHFGSPGVFGLAESHWRVNHWRKLGLESAWNADGAWARGDAPGLGCRELREALWEVVEECDLSLVTVGEREAPVLQDGYWWSFKIAERALTSPRGPSGRKETRLAQSWAPGAPSPSIVLTTVRDGQAQPPEGVDAVQIGAIDAPGCPQVEAVAVWAPEPREVCW